MTDSNGPDPPEPMGQRDREQRIRQIKRWVDYIEREPPETWGPQQNAVVDDQLEAAQSVDVSAGHRRRVSEVASEIIDERDDSSNERP